MLPKTHIILGFVFSVIVLFIFPQISWAGFILIFLSSVLIDVDHYLVFVKRKKEFNLRKAYYWWKGFIRKYKNKSKIKAPLTVFHTIEFLALTAVLALFSSIFLYILTGFLFHNFLDIIEMSSKNKLDRRQYLLFMSLFRRNKNYKYI